MSLFCDVAIVPDGPPVFASITAAGTVITATFDKPVCRGWFWDPGTWDITVNGATSDDIGDAFPLCNATRSNGVTSASIILSSAMPSSSIVVTTLSAAGALSFLDIAGNTALGPQARSATATAAETVPPTLTSAAGSVGATTITLTFSEPVFCTAFSFDVSDVFISDNDPATTDPVVTGGGQDTCGSTPVTADNSFAVLVNGPLPANTTFTVVLTPEYKEIQDIAGNALANPSTTTLTTGGLDLTPPTLVDTILTGNVGSTDFGDVGDAYVVTFSEPMYWDTSNSAVALQDDDGSTVVQQCGFLAMCAWNTAYTQLTIIETAPAPVNGGGTPGLQLPVRITTLYSFTDLAGNVPDLAGSPDRIIDGQ